VLRAFGGRVQVEEVRLDPPRAHEVRVSIAAAGLCRSDLHCRAGGFPVYKLPMVLGHEAAGVVTEVGPAVTRVRAGSHVVVTWNSSCGACWHCTRQEPAYCLDLRRRYGVMHDGTARMRADGQAVYRAMDAGALAEEQVFHENALVEIDSAVPLEEAALLGCAVSTGVGAVLNTARVPAGARVAVIGCGAVGLSVVQGARLAGAEVIVAIDVAAQKLPRALELGATHVVRGGDEDAVGAVAEITRGIGVDYAFEAVGSHETICQAIEMVRRGGVAVVIGNAPPYETMPIFPGMLTLTGKSLVGSCFGSTVPRRDVPRLVEWWRRGVLRPGELVSRRAPLAEIDDALARFARESGLRTVIVP
jgi:S-(hydroxymethyl)glutathione dehydrogenase/alcohol dehydrogenase